MEIAELKVLWMTMERAEYLRHVFCFLCFVCANHVSRVCIRGRGTCQDRQGGPLEKSLPKMFWGIRKALVSLRSAEYALGVPSIKPSSLHVMKLS